MYQDYEMEFSSNQDVGQTVGSYISTNLVDIGSGNLAKNIGSGAPIQVVSSVTEAVAGGASSTVEVVAFVNDTENLTGRTDIASSGAIPVANLGLGEQISLTLPASHPGFDDANRRYLGIVYIVAGATTTAGTMTSRGTVDPQSNS